MTIDEEVFKAAEGNFAKDYSSPANTALVQKLVDAMAQLRRSISSMEISQELDDKYGETLTEAQAWLERQGKCGDEGCPFYGTDAICEPKDGGCIATLPQQEERRE